MPNQQNRFLLKQLAQNNDILGNIIDGYQIAFVLGRSGGQEPGGSDADEILTVLTVLTDTHTFMGMIDEQFELPNMDTCMTILTRPYDLTSVQSIGQTLFDMTLIALSLGAMQGIQLDSQADEVDERLLEIVQAASMLPKIDKTAISEAMDLLSTKVQTIRAVIANALKSAN